MVLLPAPVCPTNLRAIKPGQQTKSVSNVKSDLTYATVWPGLTVKDTFFKISFF